MSIRTKKQIEASRANGQKSRGPTTAEGKRRSAMNSLLHGVFSKVLIMANEDPDEYASLRCGYFARFQPADAVEADIIGNMVASQWFLRRAWRVETGLLDVTVDTMAPKVDDKFDRIDEGVRTALGYKKLSDRSTSLAVTLCCNTWAVMAMQDGNRSHRREPLFWLLSVIRKRSFLTDNNGRIRLALPRRGEFQQGPLLVRPARFPQAPFSTGPPGAALFAISPEARA